jgi:hypothetical protein
VFPELHTTLVRQPIVRIECLAYLAGLNVDDLTHAACHRQLNILSRLRVGRVAIIPRRDSTRPESTTHIEEYSHR